MDKVIAIVGPTATGKTALSVKLAKEFGGEIVSCDSMQIYKGLNIGTAKPQKEELNQVPHHLIGFLDVGKDFSVADYVALAETVINDILQRGKLPMITGGTGLYVRSLLSGASFDENSRDEVTRKRLEHEAEEHGNAILYERLKKIDAASAEHIHPKNTKRLIRALEYYEVIGSPISLQKEETEKTENRYDYLMLCLAFRDREKLYERIDRRVDFMIEKGLLEEAKTFYDFLEADSIKSTAAQAIGYKELFQFFDGEISLEGAVSNIKKGTRHYAKRQMTWFRKEQNIDFIYIDDFADEDKLTECCINKVKEFIG